MLTSHPLLTFRPFTPYGYFDWKVLCRLSITTTTVMSARENETPDDGKHTFVGRFSWVVGVLLALAIIITIIWWGTTPPRKAKSRYAAAFKSNSKLPAKSNSANTEGNYLHHEVASREPSVENTALSSKEPTLGTTYESSKENISEMSIMPPMQIDATAATGEPTLEANLVNDTTIDEQIKTNWQNSSSLEDADADVGNDPLVDPEDRPYWALNYTWKELTDRLDSLRSIR